MIDLFSPRVAPCGPGHRAQADCRPGTREGVCASVRPSQASEVPLHLLMTFHVRAGLP